MTPEERRAKTIEQVRVAYGDTLTQVKEVSISIVKDSRETMRSLALVSGGIATGSLILLSSNIPTIPVLIIIGITSLIIEVIAIFGYILHKQNLEATEFIESRKNTLIPTSRVLSLYDELMEGSITSEDYDKKTADIARKFKEYSRKENEKTQTKEPKTDDWDLIFIGLVGFGSFMIILGLIIPNLCLYLAKICLS